ncbi:MAG: ABC transporter permease [Chloroflexi bacterium]|nr:ABC transporter permease [Chloroflexota bacterium]
MKIDLPKIGLADAFVFGLLQVGALLVSAQLHMRIFLGLSSGEAERPLTPLLFLIIGFSVGACAVLGLVSRRSPLRLRFWLSVGLSFVLFVVFEPQLSRLQGLYFILANIFLGLIVLRAYRPDSTLLSDLRALWESHSLILLWTRIAVKSRYSQAILGILWIVLLPLSTALVFTFVFTVIFRASPLENVPFVAFFLTGVTFWNLFNQSMINSTAALLGKMDLMRQVYFPREVLVIVRLFEAIVDTFFTFIMLLLVNALAGLLPSLDYLLILPVMLIQIAFTLGVMLFVSALSVFVRDIPPLVGVILQILFYLTPILYQASSIPQNFQFLVLFNPLVPLIDAYRDVILSHRMPDVISLFYPLVAGLMLLYLGYRFFKRRELLLPDYV